MAFIIFLCKALQHYYLCRFASYVVYANETKQSLQNDNNVMIFKKTSDEFSLSLQVLHFVCNFIIIQNNYYFIKLKKTIYMCLFRSMLNIKINLSFLEQQFSRCLYAFDYFIFLHNIWTCNVALYWPFNSKKKDHG